MARKAPEVIITRSKGWDNYDICVAISYYGILYDGQPFMYRNTSLLKDGIRYLKTTFSSLVSAKNACNKLNQVYETELFTVVDLLQKVE